MRKGDLLQNILIPLLGEANSSRLTHAIPCNVMWLLFITSR